MKHRVNVTVALVLSGLVSTAANLFAASLTVSPPLVMNDYVGQVSLAISGLTPGKTVLVERFIDANGNGVVDAGDDVLIFSFKVTDGQVPLIGGVRNPNVPGDDDEATDGSIRVDLPFPNVDEVFSSAAVKFIFRVSDPQNVFLPVTATFDVQQHVQPQGVSGRITAAASGAPLSRAFVVLLPPNGNTTLAAVLADADGNYLFNAAPGPYTVFVIKNGFVLDQTAGAVTVIANQFATRNLALASAGFTISGKISDSSSGAGIAGVFVGADSTNNNLFAGGSSDANGNYSFSVTADQWKVNPFDGPLAQLGYVRSQSDITTTTVGGAVTIDFPVRKATALIYGTVMGVAGNPVTGVRVDADDQGNPYETSGFTFSPNANYATGVVAGTWSVGPDPDSLAARGYIGTGSEVALNAGQALQVNFVVQAITAHLRGQIKDDSGAPIANMTIAVQPVPFQPGGGSLHPTTDNNGNFDVGVRGGTWNIALECDEAQSRGYVNIYGIDFNVIDGVDQNGLLLNFPVFTALITGSVMDDFEQPIVGVGLYAIQGINPNTFYESDCVTTDTNGNYTIKVLGGTWNVGVVDLNSRGFNNVANQDVTISGGTGTANFVATPLPPVITSPLSAAGTVGQQFVYQFETRFATSRAVSNLPQGLSFNPTISAITGQPTAAGTFQVELSATNSTATTTATLIITVQPAPASGPVIASSTSATGRAGQPFRFQVYTTGGTPATRVGANGLPPELSIDAVTGLISGTPTAEGSSAVILTVTDGPFTTTAILQLTFTADPGLPVIISPSSATLTPGQFFSYTINAPSSADPSDPTIFTLIGDLPGGLTFNAATGTISGTYNPFLRESAQGGPRKLATGRARPIGGPDLAGGTLGSIQLFATNGHGTSTFQLLFLRPPSGVVNISTRLLIGTGENVLIGGFIVTGNAAKVVIIRALGPSTGVPGALQDPTLELHDGAGHVVFNDNWKTAQEQIIRDTTIPPVDDRESAIVIGLDPGPYTAIVAGKNGATGIGLVEVYDLGTSSLDPSGTAKLAQISTRGLVDTGNNVMIGGFIISGQATRVIVRAIGPSLTASGVQGALRDTVLELRDGSGSLIFSNDDWRSTQEQQIIATGVPPADDHESAIVATLPPGNYTAIVRGKNDTTGVALVEAYGLGENLHILPKNHLPDPPAERLLGVSSKAPHPSPARRVHRHGWRQEQFNRRSPRRGVSTE